MDSVGECCRDQAVKNAVEILVEKSVVVDVDGEPRLGSEAWCMGGNGVCDVASFVMRVRRRETQGNQHCTRVSQTTRY